MLSRMSSHYKVSINSLDSNNFCIVPTFNSSSFWYINRTLKYSQVAPLSERSDFGFARLAVNIVQCFFGMTANDYVGMVSIKDKVVIGKNVTPAILSLAAANLLYLLTSLHFLLLFYFSIDFTFRIQIMCKLGATFDYGLLLF